MKKLKITIALSLLIPISSGNSQSVNSQAQDLLKVVRLQREIREIHQQVNLNLDLIEYQNNVKVE